MVTLYAGVVAFLSLLFEYINHAFPDTTLNYYYDPYQGGVAYAMSSLIVLTPVFLILMRVIRRDIARDSSRQEIWVRRWALFLTVFVAGATIVIDLIVLLNTFLSGEELSVRFLLKVLVVLLVAGAGFLHFYADIRGYWANNQQRAKLINYGVGVLVVVTIVAGFFVIGTPGTARQARIDQERVYDLQSLQSQVVYYYQQKERLPQNLAELNDPLSYYSVPMDPESGSPYEYRRINTLSFELCATFATESKGTSMTRPAEPMYGGEQNWQHGVGRTCYSRTIDPDLYPPLNPKPVR